MKNEVNNCEVEKKLKEYSQMDKKKFFEKLETTTKNMEY